MTNPTTGHGAELLAAVRAGDDTIRSVQAEWDRLPRNDGGWINLEIRTAYYGRLEQAQAARALAARECWAYFEGRDGYTGSGQATAEELAAWRLLGYHRPHGDTRGDGTSW